MSLTKEIIAVALISTWAGWLEDNKSTDVQSELNSTKMYVQKFLDSQKNPYEIDKNTMDLAIKIAEKTPIDVSNSYQALAWEVPVGYFNEIKEESWEDMAQEYKKYAEYFSSIVVPWKEKYISKKLLSVFNNPWDNDIFELFISKLSKKLDDWKEISDLKIASMLILLNNTWSILDKSIERNNLAVASQEEILKELNKKLKSWKTLLEELIEESKKLDWESKKLDWELIKVKQERERVEKEIEKVRSLIKQRWGDVNRLKARIS